MMKHNDRRTFVRKALLVPLGLSLTDMHSYADSARQSFAPANEFKSRIKLSINAWSYNVPLFKYINGEEGGMSLFDLLEECARLDVDAVDPTGYFFPGYPEVPERSFINKFKRRAFQLGLEFSGTGIRNDFATSDREKRKSDIALAKSWIEATAEMGAPVLRVFAGKQPEGHTWEEAAGWMAEALAECVGYAEKFGVMIGVQNHGDMLKTADEVLKILDMVRSDWLGVIVDTGSFLTSDPYRDIERVIPHAVNWQLKKWLSDRKGPEIDMDKLVDIIRKSSYRGYVAVETLPTPGKEDTYDALREVPELLAELRKALK